MFHFCSKGAFLRTEESTFFVAVWLEMAVRIRISGNDKIATIKANRVGERQVKEEQKDANDVKFVKILKFGRQKFHFCGAKVPNLWRFSKNATKVFRKRSFFVAVMFLNCSNDVPNLWRKCSFLVARNRSKLFNINELRSHYISYTDFNKRKKLSI